MVLFGGALYGAGSSYLSGCFSNRDIIDDRLCQTLTARLVWLRLHCSVGNVEVNMERNDAD